MRGGEENNAPIKFLLRVLALVCRCARAPSLRSSITSTVLLYGLDTIFAMAASAAQLVCIYVDSCRFASTSVADFFVVSADCARLGDIDLALPLRVPVGYRGLVCFQCSNSIFDCNRRLLDKSASVASLVPTAALSDSITTIFGDLLVVKPLVGATGISISANSAAIQTPRPVPRMLANSGVGGVPPYVNVVFATPDSVTITLHVTSVNGTVGLSYDNMLATMFVEPLIPWVADTWRRAIDFVRSHKLLDSTLQHAPTTVNALQQCAVASLALVWVLTRRCGGGGGTQCAHALAFASKVMTCLKCYTAAGASRSKSSKLSRSSIDQTSSDAEDSDSSSSSTVSSTASALGAPPPKSAAESEAERVADQALRLYEALRRFPTLEAALAGTDKLVADAQGRRKRLSYAVLALKWHQAPPQQRQFVASQLNALTLGRSGKVQWHRDYPSLLLHLATIELNFAGASDRLREFVVSYPDRRTVLSAAGVSAATLSERVGSGWTDAARVYREYGALAPLGFVPYLRPTCNICQFGVNGDGSAGVGDCGVILLDGMTIGIQAYINVDSGVVFGDALPMPEMSMFAAPTPPRPAKEVNQLYWVSLHTKYRTPISHFTHGKIGQSTEDNLLLVLNAIDAMRVANMHTRLVLLDHASVFDAVREYFKTGREIDGVFVACASCATHGVKNVRNALAGSGITITLDDVAGVVWLRLIEEIYTFYTRHPAGNPAFSLARFTQSHFHPSTREKMDPKLVRFLWSPEVIAMLQFYLDVHAPDEAITTGDVKQPSKSQAGRLLHLIRNMRVFDEQMRRKDTVHSGNINAFVDSVRTAAEEIRRQHDLCTDDGDKRAGRKKKGSLTKPFIADPTYEGTFVEGVSAIIATARRIVGSNGTFIPKEITNTDYIEHFFADVRRGGGSYDRAPNEYQYIQRKNAIAASLQAARLREYSSQ